MLHLIGLSDWEDWAPSLPVEKKARRLLGRRGGAAITPVRPVRSERGLR